jgi:branched-chain amino acid transport system permease protein
MTGAQATTTLRETGGIAALARRSPIWLATAVLFVIMPLIFDSGFALTLLSQMGVLIVFALAYNMLLGQGGMLSFGHAIYFGLAGYMSIHVLKWVSFSACWWVTCRRGARAPPSP